MAMQSTACVCGEVYLLLREVQRGLMTTLKEQRMIHTIDNTNYYTVIHVTENRGGYVHPVKWVYDINILLRAQFWLEMEM